MTKATSIRQPLFDQYQFADTYCLPLMLAPPPWTGKVDETAWSCAAGLDGLSEGGVVEERPAKVFIAATREHLCLAIITGLHPVHGLLPDDALEILIDGENRLLIRPDGSCLPPGIPGVRVDSAIHGDLWHCQVTIPKEATDATGIRLDIRRYFQAVAAHASLGNGDAAPIFRFTDKPCPAVQLMHGRQPSSGDIRAHLLIHNPSSQPLELTYDLLLRRPKRDDAFERGTVRLAPGETRDVFLKIEAVAIQWFELFAAVQDQAGEFLFTRYGKCIRNRSRWERKISAPPPVDFRFAYFPSLNRMRILADVRGLPDSAKLDRIDFVIRPTTGGSSVGQLSLPLAQFKGGTCETEFSLPPLEGVYEVIATAHGRGVGPEPIAKPFTRQYFEWEGKGLGLSRKVYPPFTPIVVEGKTLRTVLKEYRLNDVGLLDSIRTEHCDGLDVEELLAGPLHYTATVNGAPAPLRSAASRLTKRADDEAVLKSEFSLGALSCQSTSTLEYDGMLRVDLTLGFAPGQRLDRLDLVIPLRGAIAQKVHAIAGRFRDAIEARTLPAGQGVIWSSNDLPPCGWDFASYIFLGNTSRGLCWFVGNDQGLSHDPNRPNLEVTREGDTVTLHVHLISNPVKLDSSRTITFGLLAAPVKPRLAGWRHRWYTENFSVLGCDCHWLSIGNYGSFYPAGGDLALWEAIRRGNQKALSDAEIDAIIARARPCFAPMGERRVRHFENCARLNLRNREGTRMIFYYNRDSTLNAPETQTFVDEWAMEDYPEGVRGADRPSGFGITPAPSYMDFILHWYAKSFEIAGNTGVYMDNIYFRPIRNRATSQCYEKPDGSVAPSNGIWELRAQAKRTFQFLCERGMEPMHMAHMTSLELLPVLSFYTIQYDWEWQRGRGDVHGRFTRDYLQLVSAGELSGCWPIVLHELPNMEENDILVATPEDFPRLYERTLKEAADPWIIKTFLGVTIVHEIIVDPYFWHMFPIPPGDTPENRLFNTFRKPILEMVQHGDCEVYRYWDARPQPVKSTDPDVPTIVFARKGVESLVAVTNYADEDRDVELSIDPVELGLASGYRVIDVESGRELRVSANRLRFDLPRHDLKEFRLLRA